MSIFQDKAVSIYQEGYNCAQSVFVAFAESFGMDQTTAMKVSSSLGGGLGHTGEVCGAALGMALAIGMVKGYDSADAEVKMAHGARVKRMMEAFQAQFGATRCPDLQEPGNRTLCESYVRYAAMLAEAEMQGD